MKGSYEHGDTSLQVTLSVANGFFVVLFSIVLLLLRGCYSPVFLLLPRRSVTPLPIDSSTCLSPFYTQVVPHFKTWLSLGFIIDYSLFIKFLTRFSFWCFSFLPYFYFHHFYSILFLSFYASSHCLFCVFLNVFLFQRISWAECVETISLMSTKGRRSFTKSLLSFWAYYIE
jgi:hypothetical protein